MQSWQSCDAQRWFLDQQYQRAFVLSHFSYVRLFAAPWIVAHQMPQSMEFSSLEYWNRLPFPPPGYLLDPGIKLLPLTSPALASKFFTISTTWEASQYQHHLGNYKSCSHEPHSVPNKLESLRLGFCCLCSTSHPGDSKEH